jgi:PAS domain S-box-containing protein
MTYGLPAMSPGEWNRHNQRSPFRRKVPLVPIEKRLTDIMKENDQSQDLQDYLNIIQELVVSLDRRGCVTSINHKGCEILGYSRNELLGQNWFETVIPATNRQPLIEIFADVLAGNRQGGARWENDVVTATGDVRRIDFHNTLTQGSEGQITGTLSSGVDVTEVRRQERELAELQNALSQVAGLGILGEMAAGLAHEINQPLSAISTYTDACLRLLDRGSPDLSRLKHALKQVSEQAHRAGDVVVSMRSLAQQPTSDRALVNCNALIQDLITVIRADEHRAQTKTTLDLEEPLQEVSVNPVQIQQVILNYVRNAIDALGTTPATDRNLTIQTRRDGKTISCRVIDTGRGVDGDAVTELFHPFFTTKQGSVGMGLSICKTIIEHHGGQVGYEPNPDGGAVFSFTLPIPVTDPS